ncbi:MAG: hypothetical protein WBM02_02785 [bacterium]
MTKLEEQRPSADRQDNVKVCSVEKPIGIVDNCVVTDVFCDGECETCLQSKWCLLTPVFRYVK